MANNDKLNQDSYSCLVGVIYFVIGGILALSIPFLLPTLRQPTNAGLNAGKCIADC